MNVIASVVLAYWLIGIGIVVKRYGNQFQDETDVLIAVVVAWLWPLFRRSL